MWQVVTFHRPDEVMYHAIGDSSRNKEERYGEKRR
jgi:hypothetical protein